METIYKITHALAWETALTEGAFEGSGPDLVDGFIHFSTRAQVEETAEKWFLGQADLVLIGVDTQNLGPALRYEPSRGGALFPHLYGALPIAAVVFAEPLPLRPDGRHDFSGLLE